MLRNKYNVHDMGGKLSSRQDEKSRERRAQFCQAKMLKGDMGVKAKYLTETKGGVLLPDDIEDPTGWEVWTPKRFHFGC
jgi:hypothetical protein